MVVAAATFQGQFKAVDIQGQIRTCIKLYDAMFFSSFWLDVATWI